MAVNKNGIVVIGAVFVDIKGFPEDIYIPDGRNAGRIEYIHGGVSREDRRKIVERFMQDRDMLVLIANDAPLGSEWLDHPLGGNWEGHIGGDFLLAYKLDGSAKYGLIVFVRTGTHTDFF